MRILIALPICLAACGAFPALEGTVSDSAREAPYPTLTPIPVAPTAVGVAEEELSARVTALQARAKRIRQIDIAALQ